MKQTNVRVNFAASLSSSLPEDDNAPLRAASTSAAARKGALKLI
ncbi:MAG: hypothetical protein ABR577_07845 [Pyrinomonadaceae bacterium]